jgi:hypothetical protein
LPGNFPTVFSLTSQSKVIALGWEVCKVECDDVTSWGQTRDMEIAAEREAQMLLLRFRACI